MAGKQIRVEIDITAADNASSVVEGVQSSLEGLQGSMNKAREGFASMGRTSATRSPFESYTRDTNRFSKQLGSTKLEKAITVHDGVTSGIKGILSKGKSLVSKPIEIATKIAAPVTNVAKAVTSPLAMAGVSIGAGAAVSDVVKTYAGFESEMSKVKAISGATGAEFDSLTAKAKEMGAQTKFTSQEAGEAFEYMAMAGWKPQQMMSGINGVMRLAAASGEDLGSTSDIVTDAVTAFGHKATDTLKDGTNYVDHFVDVLAKASSSSNTNVSMMGETFKYAAPLAGALGFSVDDTAKAIGLMANQGIKASQAGTAMRGWLTRMSKPTKESSAAMDKLGLSLTDAKGNMKSLSTIMDETRAGFQKLSPVEKSATAAQLAGQHGMTGLLAIVNASQQDYDALTESIRNSKGAATDMSNTMLDNVQGKWTLFTSALDVMKNNLGERFKPYLMEGIQWMTDHVPDLQSALETGMDKVDQFAGKIKQAWSGLQMDPDFQSADIFGKAKIVIDKALDGIHDAIASHAKGFGKSLGTGLHNGILALLGIDVTGAVDEGQSIGVQFAKGFSSGFKTGDISKALLSKVGTLFQNAGQLFSGSGNFSSLASAALLAYGGHKLIGGGLKAAQLGVDIKKVLFGSGTPAASTVLDGGTTAVATTGGLAGLAKQAWGKFDLTPELAGTGNVVATGLAGKLGWLGAKAGATTSAGAVALGAAGVGGAAATGATAISMISDIYKSIKLGKKGDKLSQQGSEAYANSAAKKGVGIGTGAMAGAMIGSVVPVIGTGVGAAAGAGIGGVAGWISGKKDVKEYNKAVDENANYQSKAAYATKGTTFASKELNKQFKSSKVSADTFGASLQAAIDKANSKAFGKMTLSMSELSDTAKNIMFTPEQTKGLTNYQEAADTASKSLDSLQTAQKSMDKLNWKAGVSGKFSDTTDIDAYKSALDAYNESAKTYLTDQQYAANQSANMLLPKMGTGTGSVEMNQQNNAIYSTLQSRLEKATSEVEKQYASAMKDNVISSSEASAIQKAQSGVQKITDVVNSSQLAAGQQELMTRFSGAALNASSYGQLITEMQSQGKSAVDSYKKGFMQEAQTLESGHQMKLISDNDFQKSLSSLQQGYQQQLGSMKQSMQQFGINSIKDSFKLNDSAGASLMQSMNDALSKNVDFSQLKLPDMQKMFGLDKLKLPEESKDAMAQDLAQLGAGLSQILTDADLGDTFKGIRENLTKDLDKDSKDGESPLVSATKKTLEDTLPKAIEDTDISKAQDAIAKKIPEIMGMSSDSGKGVDGSASDKVSAITEGLQKGLVSSIESMDVSEVGTSLQTKLGDALTTGLTSEKSGKGNGTDVSGITQGLQESLTSSIESMDVSEVGASLQAKIGEALTSGLTSGKGGDGSSDAAGIAQGLQQSLVSSIDTMDLTEVGTSLQTKIGEALSSGITSGGGEGGDTNASGIALGLQASLASAIESMDLSEVGTSLQAKIGEALSSGISSGEGGSGEADASGIAAGLQTSLEASLESMDLSGVGASLQTKIGEALSMAGSGEGGEGDDMSGLAAGIQASLTSSLESIDLSPVGAELQSKIGEALSAAGSAGEGGDMSGIASGIQASLSSALSSIDLSGIDFSGIASSLQSQITSAINGMTFEFSSVGASIGSALGSAIASASGWQGGVSTLYSNVGNAIRGQFAGGYDVTTTVRVTINWTITNPSAGISTSASGNSVHASIGKSANGRYIDRAMLSLIGEDGPEYVIPVGSKRRARGLDLWEQAGRDLGVPGFADGGIVGSGITTGSGTMSGSIPSYVPDGDEESAIPASIPASIPSGGNGNGGGSGSTNINFNPSINPTFQVTGANSSEILEKAREMLYTEADTVVEDLAERLEEVFSSMPINAAPI